MIAESLEQDFEFVSPGGLPYLFQNGLAHDLIDSLRWDEKVFCPRCRSTYIKQVNTNVFRQLYRCIDCGYMFNCLAGTVFHGSKMPVIKYFRLFILHNALQSQLPLRDIGYALDISPKTASLLMKRIDGIAYPFQFATVSSRITAAPSFEVDSGDEGSTTSFLAYCEIKSIAVCDRLFRRFLRLLTQESISGIIPVGTTW